MGFLRTSLDIIFTSCMVSSVLTANIAATKAAILLIKSANVLYELGGGLIILAYIIVTIFTARAVLKRYLR